MTENLSFTTVETLLDRAQWVRSLIRSLVRDDEATEDIFQEVARTALERPPRDPENLTSWLARVAVNRAMFWRRSEARRSTRERAAASDEVVPGTDALVEQADLQRRLVQELLELSPVLREVLLLRFFEELPPRRIAERLDVPVNTVRSRQTRALEQLRIRLDTEFRDRRTWCLLYAPFLRSPGPSLAIGTAAQHASWLTMSGIVKLFILAVFVAGTGFTLFHASRRDAQESQNPPPLVAESDEASDDVSIAALRLEESPEGEQDQSSEEGSAVSEGVDRTAQWLRGRVFHGNTQQGVPGVNVSIGEDGRRRTETGAEGHFSYPLPEDFEPPIVFSRQGYETSSVISWTGSELWVLLTPLATLRGVVLDDRGTPVREVPLLLHRTRMEDPDPQRRLVTDAEGRFVFEDVAAGHYTVFVLRRRLDPDEFAIGQGSWELKEGDDREVTLTLEWSGRLDVTGLVHHALGSTIPMVAGFFPMDPDHELVLGKPVEGGRYLATLVETGRYWVLLMAGNDDHLMEVRNFLIQDVEVIGGPALNLDFSQPASRIVGRLEGSFDDSHVVLALPPEIPAHLQFWFQSTRANWVLGQPIQADGSFELSGLTEGPWQVEVRRGDEVLCTRRVELDGFADLGLWRQP